MAATKKPLTTDKPPTIKADTTTDAGEQIVKAKQTRNRTDLQKFGEENTKPGDNSRYLRMARASMELPPIDISDPKQVEQRICDYFDFCENNDKKPGMTGLANWLGVDSTTVSSWRRGEYRGETHSPLIKKAVQILEELWEDYMQNGKVNPVSGIFLGKITFGYKDQQEYIITPNNPLGDNSDPSTIAGKYQNALPPSDVTDENG